MDGFEDFVEARVAAIAASSDGRTITMKITKGGGCFDLILNKVDRFVANEFRHQNVIDRIILSDLASNPASIKASLSTLVSGSSDPAVWDEFSQVIEEEQGAISGGRRIMLEIEPVYGVSVIALAATYSLERV